MFRRLFALPAIYYLLTFTLVPVGVATYYFIPPRGDIVNLSNTSGSENGILVVGEASPPSIYKGYVSNTGTFHVGQVTLNAINNEVVGFTNDRAVEIQPTVPWTIGSDIVNMPLSGPIVIDVTVWIVRGNFMTGSSRATAMKLTTMSIWQQERMGVTFGAFDINDATSNPGITGLFSNFNNCLGMRGALQTAVGRD